MSLKAHWTCHRTCRGRILCSDWILFLVKLKKPLFGVARGTRLVLNNLFTLVWLTNPSWTDNYFIQRVRITFTIWVDPYTFYESYSSCCNSLCCSRWYSQWLRLVASYTYYWLGLEGGKPETLCLCWPRALRFTGEGDSRNCSMHGFNLSIFLPLIHVMFCFIFPREQTNQKLSSVNSISRLFLWVHLTLRCLSLVRQLHACAV